MQALPSPFKAARTIRQPVELPQIDEDATAPAEMPVRQFQTALDVGESWCTEQPLLSESFQSPITSSCRDEGDGRRAGRQCNVDRPEKPVVLCVGSHEWWRDQQKRTQCDRTPPKLVGRQSESINRHSFVQPFQRFGMRRFQTHRDLEMRWRSRVMTPFECVQKPIQPRSNERGVRFDDDVCQP